MKQTDLYELALQFADETAISDIEMNCLRNRDDSGRYWYDTRSAMDDDREWVNRALVYLELRELIERHQETPDVIRFTCLTPSAQYSEEPQHA